jgi:hypothetical protein
MSSNSRGHRAAKGNAMTKDNLLNELERQEKYLAELPTDFSFPLFNTRRALESQRQNGYRNTAVAAREIVDNAFEAQATKVHVIFKTAVHTTRQVVSSVAFIDNGAHKFLAEKDRRPAKSGYPKSA